MKEQRKLAAIMFTDIVGYTALMSKDEQHAHQIIHKSRDILKKLIGQYNGEWLQAIGDGTLSSFASVVEAVNCALEIQRTLRDEPELSLRIGIHIGDVVFADGEVYGDGVNVASRLEPLAEPGGICISGQVYRNIRNKPGIAAIFMGEKTLKNVDLPMKVYALAVEEPTAALTESYSAERTPTIKLKPSIAVMPFINMSADPEQEYFCDGMTEEIINALTHIENLRVIARTSCFVFKGKHEDIREIGRKLDVITLLEGSVRKAGNRLRITAQLIKVSDGSHLWSEKYDREMEDVFAIQDEISLAIVDKLKVKLLGKEKAAIVKRHTEDLEAYNLYLKGNYYSQMLTMEEFEKAIVCYEQALQKDPHYALAYTGLASLYWYSSFWGNVPPNEAYPKAKEYAKKALEIDNTLAEAHSLLGVIKMNYDWNWKAAEGEFKQALKLNPNTALIHTYYSFLFTLTENHDEAIAEAKRARELDPLSSYINTHVGGAFFFAGRCDEAIEELRMTLTINPNYFLAHHYLGLAYWERSVMEEAIAEFEKAVDLSGGNPFIITVLATAYYKSGKKDKAEKLFDSLKQRSRDEYVPPTCFYWIHRVRDEQDQAFECLERACNEHDSFLPWFRVTPIDTDRFPDEPRFKALLTKAGFGK
jgi:adenylate cyclase